MLEATHRPPPGPTSPRTPAHAHERRDRGSRRLLVVGIPAFVGLVALLYLAGVHSGIANSDGATAVLAGHAMATGDPLLKGWSVSLDSFWSNEEIFYALADKVVGVRPEMLFAVPAILAALTVAVGIVVASGGRRHGAAVAGAATVVALLAFPTHTLALFYLHGPLHIGTVLWSLGAFWLLRDQRFGWRYAVAVALLATNMLGDLEGVAYATVPVGLAGAVSVLRRREWRPGAVTASAAALGALTAEIVRRVAVAVGSYSVTPSTHAATTHQMVTNFGQALDLGEQLLGVRNVSFGSGGVPVWLQRVHVLAAAVVAVCFAVAAIRLAHAAATGADRRDDATSAAVADRTRWRSSGGALLDDMLMFAVIGATLTFVDEAFDTEAAFARYLTAAVLFAAVLTGRTVARWWDRRSPSTATGAIALVGLGAMASFAAGVGYNLAAPRPVQPATQVARWLEARGFHDGLGDYWSSSITTVASDGLVRVRPVVVDPHDHLVAYDKGPLDAWFSGRRFDFLVFSAPEAFGSVDLHTARATWGNPLRVYPVGGYDVVVWRHPVTVGV